MPKRDIRDALQRRASSGSPPKDDQAIEAVYQGIFGAPSSSPKAAELRSIPANKLRHFFTAKIGFHPYTEAELAALAEDIRKNGLLEKGKARPIPGTDEYEVMSGNSRMDACLLLGWPEIPFEVEPCSDARAVVIATVTNLTRRQHLAYSERAWAYRALLEAQSEQGKRSDLIGGPTCGEIHHKSKTRDKVADYFGVTTHELRQLIRLTYLIQPLLDAVDRSQLKVTLGVKLSDCDTDTQQVFYDHWMSRQKQGDKLSPGLLNFVFAECPPPAFTKEALAAAWAQYLEKQEMTIRKKPVTVKFTVDRERFAPLIAKLGGEEALETLFLEFLESRAV